MIRLSGFRPTAEGVDRATDIDAVALAVSSHESSFRDADLAYRLRGLAMIGSVLHLGTHPDDEEAGLMAYLSRGLGARAVYWSATRGEGGQNRTGPERGEALGVIRTWESLDARTIDGGEVLYGPFYDYGFSRSGEDALRRWDGRCVRCSGGPECLSRTPGGRASTVATAEALPLRCRGLAAGGGCHFRSPAPPAGAGGTPQGQQRHVRSDLRAELPGTRWDRDQPAPEPGHGLPAPSGRPLLLLPVGTEPRDDRATGAGPVRRPGPDAAGPSGPRRKLRSRAG